MFYAEKNFVIHLDNGNVFCIYSPRLRYGRQQFTSWRLSGFWENYIPNADTIKKDSDNIVFWIKTTIPQGMTHPDISKKFYSATYKYVVNIKNRTQRLDYLVLYDKDSNILKSYNWSSVDKPEAIVPESDLEAIFLKAMSIASKQQRK